MAAASPLEAWYSRLSARYVDLVGDYAGKEHFFVEGDSLLLGVFGNPQLDFAPGYQVLHATYLVEQFAHNLFKRGCQYDIVFFHNHERNCIPPGSPNTPRYLLSRKIIIQHLRAHATKVNVLVFRSLEDPLFSEYLESSSSLFALCADGTSYSTKPMTRLDLKGDSIGDATKATETLQMKRLRGIIYQLLRRGLDVGLLNGLEFQDSKVFAFIMERTQGSRDLSIKSEIAHLQASAQTGDMSHRAFGMDQIALVKAAFGPVSMRLILTVLTLKKMDDKFLQFLPPCLAHTILLDTIPLAARRFDDVRFDDTVEAAVTTFIDTFSDQLSRSINTLPGRDDLDASLVDIFDGRLFRHILAHSGEALPAIVISSLPPLVRFITGDRPIPGICFAKWTGASIQVTSPKVRSEGKALGSPSSIMPFSHPAFDNHLQEIHVIVKETSNPKAGSDKLSQELTYWHNSKKPLLIKRSAPQDPIAQQRLMRSNQRFMAEMLSYAASLTSTTGKSLSPELILGGTTKKPSEKTLAVRDKEVSHRSLGNARLAQQKSSRQGPGKSKNDKIAAEAAERAKEARTAMFKSWNGAREVLESTNSPEERYCQTNRYLTEVKERKDVSAVINDVELFKLSALLETWVGYCRQSKKSGGMYVAALIHDILVRLSRSTTEFPREAHMILTNLVGLLGLGLELNQRILVEPDHTPSFAFHIPLGLSLSIDLDPTDFCLAHTGPYMDRSMNSKQDDRVSFLPDEWQRRVLDALDASRSILVVAPTSSGKTFISFYAMEKVLRANDDDVVVYVAPTKALVNQVAAEVIARFKKNYKYPGTSIYAIHTRDYRVNVPTQCQVLVTVPHILQIMLMSPANQKWVPRIKTIIFDEVHTINQAEDGVVWEQLLLMAPCQIIALSATVGNPAAFSDWLSSTQSTFGRQFEVIEHEHRFSDLRKYVFERPGSFTLAAIPVKPQLAPLGLESVEGFTYLHPVRSLREGRMPADLSLESRDCLLLWQAMKKFEDPKRPVPPELTPSTFFNADVIAKSDIIAWGGRLKALLVEWMKSSEATFQRVLEELGKNLATKGGPPQPLSGHDVSNVEDADGLDSNSESSPENVGKPHVSPAEQIHRADSSLSRVLDSTLPLLCKLRSSNALPAILFNYNRSYCEDIVRHLQHVLLQAELSFKETNATWKAKIRDFESWKEANAKQKPKASKNKKPARGDKGDRDGNTKLDLERDAAGLVDRRFEGFDPNAPIDDFSFADPKKSNREELDKFIDYFRWRGIDEDLVNAFQRGIGVHHAGMNRKYRQAVEICFRRGFLTVVVATGTLSLGINMPCKSVVFSGDSVYLTALNFRQASGRAGRRGFDLLGNVVFHEIGVGKACRLLSSRLPDLNGHFPLTTSFVLRLLGLLHGTKNADYAMQMVNSLLSHPRLYLGGDSFRHQVLHHVRFSIEYLRSQGLIGPQGEPLNLSSCVSHLYFAEKGAFAFHALFRHEVFHRLSEAMSGNETDTLRSLMLIMSHLFGRRPMRAAEKESEKEVIKLSSSVVFLPDLPQDVAQVLNEHNDDILSIHQLYVRTYVDQHCNWADTTLPLTKISIKLSDGAKATSLTTNLPPTKLRSPFVALSGHGDHFDSISDLCGSVRDGVFLEKAVIPYLDMGEELTTPLNAYLYDFYQHGQVAALEAANRIPRGEVWFMLKDFSLILATLVTSLENFVGGGDNLDLDLSTVGAVSDEIELDVDESEDQLNHSGDRGTRDGSMAGSNAKETVAAMSQTAERQTIKKAKVLDSWDDDNGDDDDDSSDRDGEGDIDSQRAPTNRADTSVEIDRQLKKILLMFKKLQGEFDAKFRKTFA
jgi:hypothetical protein